MRNPLPSRNISGYVDRILVIENNQITTPFILPLYANGIPAILFKSVKGKLGDDHSNHHKLSGIAFQNGYAGQSHYIRSFKEFTNITPKGYRRPGLE